MHGFNDPMPADKLMKLFIIQSISSFVAGDYDSGVHYLNEIKQTYAEKMSTLNPTLKKLAKEIIQSVDLFNPDSSIDASGNFQQTSNTESSSVEQPEARQPNDETAQQPSSVTSELQELLKRRRKERKDRG